ncbi:MAG: hypothetical protein R6V58_06790, partial [Planctomycetota bacterium]
MRDMIFACLVLLIALPVTAAEPSVPLQVTEPAGLARVNAPVTGGVPVGPLGAKSAGELVLADEEGKAVPAQVSPMVRAEDGRLLWVLVDTQVDLPARGAATFSLRRRRPADPPAAGPADHGLRINGRPAADAIADLTEVLRARTLTLSNGLVQIELSPERFNLFENVWADADGDGRFADDEKLLDPSRPEPPKGETTMPGAGVIPALSVHRPDPNAVYSTRFGKADKVAFEDAGPFRTTVRLDGTYGRGKGDRWLGWTCRVTMWAGRRDVRVLYALRNVNPKLRQQEKVKRATLRLRLAGTNGSANYLLGAADVRMSRVTKSAKQTPKGSQWHSRVVLEQVGPCEAVCGKSHRRFHHLVNYRTAGYRVLQDQPSGRMPVADVGFECDGWLALDGGRGSALVWLRNFTRDNPKRVEAVHAGTITLDLIPPDDGSPQPYYSKGGYWLGD